MIAGSDVCGIFLGFRAAASAAPRGDHGPDQRRDPALIRRVIDRLRDNDRRETDRIVHGDAHRGNLFLDRDGAPGYIARLAYRQHAMWMFMTTRCPVASHPEEIRVHNAERACAAITDPSASRSIPAAG